MPNNPNVGGFSSGSPGAYELGRDTFTATTGNSPSRWFDLPRNVKNIAVFLENTHAVNTIDRVSIQYASKIGGAGAVAVQNQVVQTIAALGTIYKAAEEWATNAPCLPGEFAPPTARSVRFLCRSVGGNADINVTLMGYLE